MVSCCYNQSSIIVKIKKIIMLLLLFEYIIILKNIKKVNGMHGPFPTRCILLSLINICWYIVRYYVGTLSIKCTPSQTWKQRKPHLYPVITLEPYQDSKYINMIGVLVYCLLKLLYNEEQIITNDTSIGKRRRNVFSFFLLDIK